jgi:nicotinamide riboside kinase
LGAESTGTTTLAEDLHANIPSSEMIYEYGREYIQNKIKVSNVPIENLEITSEEIEYFAEKQFLHEENMVKQTGCPFLICDTDAFASQIWHKRYVGIFSGKIEEIVSKQKKRTLYVITSMEDIPLEYDGTRDGNDLIRKEMENDFISGLKKRNQPFIIVKGTRWERIHQVLQKLNLNKEIINM